MIDGAIINIRPLTYRDRFHDAFASIGWRIIDSPVLVPEPMNTVLPSPQGYDAVIFTSQIAVEMLKEASAWTDKVAYAVGPATAAAARHAGYSRTIQTGLDSRDLIDALSGAGFSQAFYPSAEDVSADVSLDDPVRIRRQAIYRMAPAVRLTDEFLDAARARRHLIVPLFSRRSAQTAERLLLEAGITVKNASLGAVAISGDVLTSDAGPWQRRGVADKPTLEAVVACTAAMAADLNFGTVR